MELTSFHTTFSNPGFEQGLAEVAQQWRAGHTWEWILRLAIDTQPKSRGIIAGVHALQGWYAEAEREAQEQGYTRPQAEKLVARFLELEARRTSVF